MSTATTVLGLIRGIRNVRKSMKDNHGQNATLADRVLVLKEPLEGIKAGRQVVHTQAQKPALQSLEASVRRADELISKFGEKTVVRKLDRFFKHSGWSQDFASVNAALTQACADLLNATAEQRREQDMRDQQLAFEELIAAATREMHEDNEATEENLRLLQLQVAEQHRAVIDAIIRTNGYSPLQPAELATLESQQSALMDLSRQQFASLGTRLDDLGAQVRRLLEGHESDELRRLRQHQLQELCVLAGVVVEEEGRRSRYEVVHLESILDLTTWNVLLEKTLQVKRLGSATLFPAFRGSSARLAVLFAPAELFFVHSVSPYCWSYCSFVIPITCKSGRHCPCFAR